MNLATELSRYEQKGFNPEQAQTIVLMAKAASILFADFPDTFILFGGATLVLFHNSVRHSADLDLLSTTEDLPPVEALVDSLRNGLKPVAEALGLGSLEVIPEVVGIPEIKVAVNRASGERLFRVDLNRFGSVLESAVEEHNLSRPDNSSTRIKAASREFLLLQKAEAFLLRRRVKMRDAYDITLLMSQGASLEGSLRDHFRDTLMAHEIEATQIQERIGHVRSTVCRAELKPILPSEIYDNLEEADFQQLSESLRHLYEEWL